MMSEENVRAANRIIAEVWAKAWADEGYKARLLADPAAVLTAEGIAPPPGVTLRVVEDTATIRTLVLPAKPADLTEEELGRIVGGSNPSYSANWCMCCANCAI
jgi:hypothetical protein